MNISDTTRILVLWEDTPVCHNDTIKALTVLAENSAVRLCIDTAFHTNECFSNDGFHLENESNVYDIDELVDSCDMVFIPTLSAKFLNGLEKLDCDSPFSMIAVSALIKCKRVFSLALHSSEVPGNAFLSEKIKERNNQIERTGISLCNVSDIENFLSDDKLLSPENPRQKRKILTENDIIKMHKAGVETLCISRNDIITPLALDTAKERHITVIFK